MRRSIYFLIIALLLLVTVNLPKVSLAITFIREDMEFKNSNYHFSSDKSNGFSVWSRKGFDDVKQQFEIYKKRNPTDTILYRNFSRQYWKVWRWQNYVCDEAYQLPFKDLPKDAYRVSRGLE